MSIKIQVKPKEKILLKSSKVRHWIKQLNSELEKQINTPEYRQAMSQSIAMGLPIMLFSDGHIELIDPYKNEPKHCRKHLWKTIKAKPFFSPDASPGAVNYYFGEELIIQICVRCKKVKGNG